MPACVAASPRADTSPATRRARSITFASSAASRTARARALPARERAAASARKQSGHPDRDSVRE